MMIACEIATVNWTMIGERTFGRRWLAHHAHAGRTDHPGRLDVILATLGERGPSDHPPEGRPVGHGDGEQRVLGAQPERDRDGDGQDQRRKREEDVHDPAEHVVNRTAEVAGDSPTSVPTSAASVMLPTPIDRLIRVP